MVPLQWILVLLVRMAKFKDSPIPKPKLAFSFNPKGLHGHLSPVAEAKDWVSNGKSGKFSLFSDFHVCALTNQVQTSHPLGWFGFFTNILITMDE